MKNEQFNEIILDMIETTKEVLLQKNEGYSVPTDRLHGFRQAALLQGVTTKQALMGMLSKHTVSVYDMAMADEDTFSMEQWREKLGDSINYHFLLLALVIDERTPVALDNEEVVDPLPEWIKHELAELRAENEALRVRDGQADENSEPSTREEIEEGLVEQSSEGPATETKAMPVPAPKRVPAFLQ